ncbi:MAG: exodeoxyribonuclease V subunit beta [Desulfosoma sp.]
MTQPLDPLLLPLEGVRLIEASAGTGKTHSIVTLVLRLLVERRLPIGQILVVTYTNAATEELRVRIRQRLHGAWREVSTGRWNDPMFAPWVSQNNSEKENLPWLLMEAACRMDEAAVYTMHGFCQRILQEFAFACGVPFDWDVLPEDKALVREAVADFWRHIMKDAEEEKAQWLLSTWKGPDGLLQDLSALRSVVPPKIFPELSSESVRNFADAKSLFQEIRNTWQKDRDHIAKILKDHKALNRRFYRVDTVETLLTTMDTLADTAITPIPLPSPLERLSSSFLAQKVKAGAAPPSHQIFDLFDRYLQLQKEILEGQRTVILKAADDFVRQALSRRKDLERVLGFDDLVQRVDEALSGPYGAALSEKIRQKYPVALIDEFQDTDPLQYRIFEKIYGSFEAPFSMCLIGDPKQAIYSFRGADIFAYMRAKRNTGPANTYTMDTNWRSSSHLVHAINHLFSRHPYPFIFHQDIPFYPVRSGPEADKTPLRLHGKVPPAVQIRFLPCQGLDLTKDGSITVDAAVEAAASDCAATIVEWLNLSQQGLLTIGEEPLRARDIAVLVRSHREGRRIQEALRQRGVASVSLQRDSVFRSLEATDLLAVLEAIADPVDERRLRWALATETLGWNARRLSTLDSYETLMEDVQSRFHRYREIWNRHGFLAAFMTLLKEEGVPVHVRALPAGERRLTNLLHLAELLHRSSQSYPGVDRLLRWYKDRLQEENAPEEEQLRLESDENLVQVVTIHKSKGLEYPVVFLPFPWNLRRTKKDKDSKIVRFHDAKDLSPCVDLGSSEIDQHRIQAEREEMAEYMRLLYVALTRAKYVCVTWWGRVSLASESAMAYLLFPEPGVDRCQETARSIMDQFSTDEDSSKNDEKLRKNLEAIAQSSSGVIAVEIADWQRQERLRSDRERKPVYEVKRFQAVLGLPWRVTSYSHLTTGAESHTPDYDGVLVDESPLEEPFEQIEPIFLFPRGTRAGQCLHEIFEKIDFATLTPQDLEPVIADTLSRHGLEQSWHHPVLQMVCNVLETPLVHGTESLSLRDIAFKDRFHEWEFHFPTGALNPDRLYRALQHVDFYEKSVKGLQFESVHGLVHGFIDLVFRYRGRYFIADYKSNHLGNRVEDYGSEQLESAMHKHRYPLQMLLYTVAVHRFLGLRLPRYDYDTHFGGVFYLFLRGMRPENKGITGVFYHRPEKPDVLRLSAMFSESTG